jgi:signal transduction histidine kinase
MRRLSLLVPFLLAVLWCAAPFAVGDSLRQQAPIVIRIATPGTFLTLVGAAITSAGALFGLGWRLQGKRSLFLSILFSLILLGVIWIGAAWIGFRGTEIQPTPIVIRAATPQAGAWIVAALAALAWTVEWSGRRVHAGRVHRRQQEQVLVLARDHLDEGIVLLDRRRQPQWMNQRGQDLVYHAGQLSTDVSRLVDRAAEGRRLVSQRITLDEDQRINVQVLPLAGDTVAVIARPVHQDAGAQSFYERFIRRIVHDMRNPLAAIIAHASNLHTAPSPDLAVWQATAQTIENDAQRLTRLVDSILFDARLSYMPLAAETFDLADLIEEVMLQYDERASREGKTIEVETTPTPALIEADRDLLTRALGNVVDNSLKYSQPGSFVRITLETADHGYVVRVLDSGDGIPAEYLPARIFEPLVRIRPKDGGSGLGLSIVKKILELHGGNVRAESSIGQGTTIILCLPR